MSNASRYQRRVRNGRTGSSAVIAEGFDLLIGGSRWVWIHLSVVKSLYSYCRGVHRER
jgi:hypothetical protein